MIGGPVVAPRSGGRPEQLVVLLHGYGADGEDLIGLTGALGEVLPKALFAAPNAPARCAQNPFGYEWYPLDFEAMIESARRGTPAARAALDEYLEDSWSRTDLGPAQTFLLGFSQGAMMALHVGLSLSAPLLGIVSFSGALVPPEGLGSTEAKPPICLIHGDVDPVVDPELTRDAARVLGAHGYDVATHFSAGTGHGISPDGLEAAMRFMTERVAAATA